MMWDQLPMVGMGQLRLEQKFNPKREDIIRVASEQKNKYIFVQPLKPAYVTKFHFPSVSEERIEMQAQCENYERFVRGMADMVQKYAPELIREMEDV